MEHLTVYTDTSSIAITIIKFEASNKMNAELNPCSEPVSNDKTMKKIWRTLITVEVVGLFGFVVILRGGILFLLMLNKVSFELIAPKFGGPYN